MGDYTPGDVANGHVLGEDLVWRPLGSTSRSSEPASSAQGRKGRVWALAVLSGLVSWLLASAFVPYPDGDAYYRAGYFFGHAAFAVVVTGLIVKRVDNWRRVLLVLALPSLIAAAAWALATANQLAT